MGFDGVSRVVCVLASMAMSSYAIYLGTFRKRYDTAAYYMAWAIFLWLGPSTGK